MNQRIYQWYQGKDIRVDPSEPDTIGGMGVLHETYKEFHWSAKAARALVAFYLKNWQWFWGFVLAVAALVISVLALGSSGGHR